MTEKIIVIAKDVQKFINEIYDEYAKRYHNLSKHRFNIKQEVISKAGFWVAKKRYAQLMIYKEGVSLVEMDVKGIDVVRSDFPPAYKKFFENILYDILNKKTMDHVNKRVSKFKSSVATIPIEQIIFPVGVKDLSKYESANRNIFTSLKGAPIHVKSSIYYNDLLDFYNLDTGYITNGEKIKWLYLKNNEFNIETIALKQNAPAKIVEFANKYIDREKMFESKLKNKLTDFYSALNWSLVTNENVNKFFSF